MNQSAWKLLGKGSAKDILLHEKFPNHVRFDFSDRLSVFDYGALPELFVGRGQALELFAKEIESLWATHGIPSSYDSILSKIENCFIMRRASGVKIDSSGSDLKSDFHFIPLEIIFRFGVPEGSSLFKRRSDFEVNQKFQEPLIEYSTKLESRDRIVTEAEAVQLAGSKFILDKIETLTIKASKVLHTHFKKIGLDLWDGKFEMALDRKTEEVFLVDAVTPDELRLSISGLERVPLSKEIVRQWLGATPWAREVAAAKEKFGDDWKSQVQAPPKLGEWRTSIVVELYRSLAQVMKDSKIQSLLKLIREGSQLKTPKVYIFGSGGREAALKWRAQKEGLTLTDNPESADTVVVTQDADLAQGVADDWRAKGCFVSGPSKIASQIEWSKNFGREVAKSARIPIPEHSLEFQSIRKFSQVPVIKCDGLAAGKGVVLPKSFEEAEKVFNEFSEKGPVLVEERLNGVEASAFFYVRLNSSNSRCVYLGSAQDFKKRFAGDEGPNTGGMGALCPHPQVTSDDEKVFQDFADQTVQVLMERNFLYEGVIYLGLMKDSQKGWSLIEYNARLGDPETQALVMSWPLEKKVLAPLWNLDLSTRLEVSKILSQTLCLALVRPEYPSVPSKSLELKDWKPALPEEQIVLFRNSSTQGRVAYLVGRGENHREAADYIFESLIHCPWKDLLEWRADLLP